MAPLYPVTAGFALMAIVATMARMFGGDIDRLVVTDGTAVSEPWRFLTSVFPHGNFLHLMFNLSGVWVFGTIIEEEYGHLRTGLMMAVLGAGATAAEFALFGPSIGLSGVLYGMGGFLWVAGMSANSPFRDALDDRVFRGLIAWFFICIVLTYTGAYPVANAAHGFGFVMGAALGLCESLGRRRVGNPALGMGLTAALLAVSLAGATVARPYVNLSRLLPDPRAAAMRDMAARFADDAFLAAKRGDHAAAVTLLRGALQIDASKADWWFNLALSLQSLGRDREALAALTQVVKLSPEDAEARKELENLQEQIDRAGKDGKDAPRGKGRDKTKAKPADRGAAPPPAATTAAPGEAPSSPNGSATPKPNAAP
jgi:membrane associated rhomboid family serine protease